MLEQLQAWHNPLPGIPLEELLTKRLKHLLRNTRQHILLIEVVGIKRRTPDPRAIQQVLHSDRVIAFLQQEFHHGGTHQAAGALGSTILFVLLHWTLSPFRTISLICAVMNI